ncbi:MAG: PTS sugar transporter subunit IIC [Erysipelotrichaceae bacterium]
MKNFSEWMEKHFVPIAAKIGSQKHLVAIRDGFIGIMPITMAGAIATLLNVFVRDLPNKYMEIKDAAGNGTGTSTISNMFKWLIGINGNVWWATLAMLSLVFAFSFGYALAKAYDVNPLAGGLVGFASFIAVLPQGAAATADLGKGADLGAEAVKHLTSIGAVLDPATDALSMPHGTWGNLDWGWTNSNGLFTALIVGLVCVIIYAKLMQANVTIKLPEQVPPAVSKAFAAIVPGTIAIYVAGAAQWAMTEFAKIGIPAWIMKTVQAPFMELSQGLGAILIITFFVQLFWFFGLHGPNVLAPALDGIYKPALFDNTKAYNAGTELPFAWTRGSFDAFVWMGGSGCTIALIIAIFIFSKREESRAVAKLSVAMGCFNINEPVIFGLPIVLNPIYFIPWLLIPLILTVIAYFATTTGLVGAVCIEVPWVLPPVIYALLATGVNVPAAILAAFNLVLAVILWAPFVMVANKIDMVDNEG